MAYAALIFLNHNIQRLLDCTVSFEITNENRRHKVSALNELLSNIMRSETRRGRRGTPPLVRKQDPEPLKAKIRRMDGTISRKIGEATQSLANVLRRLDGARDRSIEWSWVNAADAEIRDAVWELEDVLQSYAFHVSLSPSRGGTQQGHDLAFFDREQGHDLAFFDREQGHDLVDEYIDSFLCTVEMLGEKYNRALYGELLPQEEEEEDDDCGSRRSALTVGTSYQLQRIVTELLDHQPGLKTVSLFGMAGIGKTHLAREICHHPLIARGFDLLVWVTVGPRQHLKNVWADVIAQMEGKTKGQYIETGIITLVGILRKNLLSGRRYLIVLDDIWSSEVCYSLIKLLGLDGNRTRVLVTTRLEDVAKYFESSIHQRPFLTNEESWELLWKNVFDDDGDDDYSFPPQLEEAGRKIAEKCEGLPLLILTVADILHGLDKTQEYWNKVADERTTTFIDAYDKIAKVLSSSYDYLPQYLKPCFLYTGVFPQKCKIAVSKLIHLLTAEDFIESERSLVRLTVRTQKKAYAKMFMTPPRIAHVEQEGYFPKILSTLTRRRAYAKQEKRPRSCNKVTKAFETLYLLEPGPAPTRYITPFEKIDSSKQKQYRIREADADLQEPSPDSETLDDLVATTENFAMECAERLVANSLVIVCKQSSKSRIKSCKLHSAYWHLCVKEAKKTKFFHVLNKLRDASEECIEGQRRLSVQNNILFGIKEVYNSVSEASTVRSLLFTGEDHRYPVPICSNLVHLRVLDALAIRFYDFPTEVLKLLMLRYLSLTHYGGVPSSVSKLTQLQFFAVRQHHNIKLPRNPNCLPGDIWDMHQLTHLWITGSYLSEPRPNAGLPNLYALHIDASSCREDVFESIPYLKKLAIRIEVHPVAAAELEICCLENVKLLNQLESLKCVVFNPRLKPRAVALPNHLLDMPTGLKKLSLNGLGYPWEYMSAIGSLPNLQVLKLRLNAFRGAKWEPKSGEFMRLEYLLLEDVDLVHWTIDDDGDEDEYFPNLRRLIIRNCYKLKKIPLDISTLEALEVVDCSPAIVEQVHRDANHSSVQLVIKSSWKV